MRGGIPLPPLLSDFSINLFMIIALLGDGRAARVGSTMCKEPPRTTARFSPGFLQSLIYHSFVNPGLIDRKIYSLSGDYYH